jgi:hypothetical protein
MEINELNVVLVLGCILAVVFLLDKVIAAPKKIKDNEIRNKRSKCVASLNEPIVLSRVKLDFLFEEGTVVYYETKISNYLIKMAYNSRHFIKNNDLIVPDTISVSRKDVMEYAHIFENGSDINLHLSMIVQ